MRHRPTRTLRCAILDDYQQVALHMADWSTLSTQVEVVSFQRHFESEHDAVQALLHFDIVIAMRERTPFPASLFTKLPNLVLLVTTGMRNAAIDLAAAKDHGVTVCGTASLSEPPTEQTWALILGLARNIVQENHAFQHGGRWQSTVGVGLHGKQLGLLGLGRIGSRVAQIGLAFGMNVVAWSPHLTKERTDAAGVGLAHSIEDLFTHSDVVSIHLQYSERTKGLVGSNELARMKPSAYLINTSRANIIDQAALIHVLQNHHIAGAGLDVYETEPVPTEDILRKLPNVLATPHLGYVTKENYRLYYTEALEDIVSFLKGVPIRLL